MRSREAWATLLIGLLVAAATAVAVIGAAAYGILELVHAAGWLGLVVGLVTPAAIGFFVGLRAVGAPPHPHTVTPSPSSR